MRRQRTAYGRRLKTILLVLMAGGLTTPVLPQEAVCNRTIVPGVNLVTFPMITPVANAHDVCALFGKTGQATTLITQYTGSAVQAFTCDQETAGFPLLASQGLGIRIFESGASATGTITGSHDPNQAVTIPRAGSFPVGHVVYAYPATTCNPYSTYFCREAGLTLSSDGPLLVRYGPLGTVDAAATCDSDPGFAFRFCGEGIRISNEVNGPKTFVPRVQPCN